MPGAGNVEHVEVVFVDQPIQVNVNEIQSGRRSPMAEQPWFDVLFGKGLLEQWVVIQIDLTDRQVIGGPPVRIHQGPFFIRKGVRHHCLQ